MGTPQLFQGGGGVILQGGVLFIGIIWGGVVGDPPTVRGAPFINYSGGGGYPSIYSRGAPSFISGGAFIDYSGGVPLHLLAGGPFIY